MDWTQLGREMDAALHAHWPTLLVVGILLVISSKLSSKRAH